MAKTVRRARRIGRTAGYDHMQRKRHLGILLTLFGILSFMQNPLGFFTNTNMLAIFLITIGFWLLVTSR